MRWRQSLEGDLELGSLNMMLYGESLQALEQRGFPKSHFDLLLGLGTEGVKGTLVLQGCELEHSAYQLGRCWGCSCSL